MRPATPWIASTAVLAVIVIAAVAFCIADNGPVNDSDDHQTFEDLELDGDATMIRQHGRLYDAVVLGEGDNARLAVGCLASDISSCVSADLPPDRTKVIVITDGWAGSSTEELINSTVADGNIALVIGIEIDWNLIDGPKSYAIPSNPVYALADVSPGHRVSFGASGATVGECLMYVIEMIDERLEEEADKAPSSER